MSYQLKTRSDVHLARKSWHILGVLLILAIYRSVDHLTAVYLITLFASLSIIIDLLRQQLESFNKIVISVMHPFMRESERKNATGTTSLLLGVGIVIILFPPHIASLSLIMLATADPLASYVGVNFGTDKIIGNKSLQGTFAAFLWCSVLSAVFYFSQNLMTERLLIVSVLTGIIGALAELLPIGKLDDNFSMPVTSSFALWGLFYLFGGFQ